MPPGGTGPQLRDWLAAGVASWTARALPLGLPVHPATVCRPWSQSAQSASHQVLSLPFLPPATLTSPGTLEIPLQLQRCYCIPFFPRTFSPEMLVKIPSFPVGEGVWMAAWAMPLCVVTSLRVRKDSWLLVHLRSVLGTGALSQGEWA